MNQPLIIENTEDPWAIIDSPWGELPAWKVRAMALGAAGALQELHNMYQLVRSDSADATARADADNARIALLQDFCAKLDGLHRRADALEEGLAVIAARRRRRADQQAREAFEAEPLTLPPGIEEYQASNPPAKIEDEATPPGGELHAVALKEEPSIEDSDNIGDLPEELRDIPEPTPEPKGSVLPQPTALFGS